MAMAFYHLDKKNSVILEDKFTGTKHRGTILKVTWLTLHIRVENVPEGQPDVWKFSRRSGKGWRADCPLILPYGESHVVAGLEVTGAICPSCGEWVYSRAHHDCRHCTCGGIFVDGGPHYLRLGYTTAAPVIEHRKLDYHLTRTMLYDDWNTGKSRFGRQGAN